MYEIASEVTVIVCLVSWACLCSDCAADIQLGPRRLLQAHQATELQLPTHNVLQTAGSVATQGPQAVQAEELPAAAAAAAAAAATPPAVHRYKPKSSTAALPRNAAAPAMRLNRSSMFAEPPAPSVAAPSHTGHKGHGKAGNGGSNGNRLLSRPMRLSLAEAEQQLMQPSALVSHRCAHEHGRLPTLLLI
uniref:Uncharacterized protein n=1 Tax=Tetradesmus obliquus TaxID=3088 RepID=A0A383W720_TETOB